jgi:DnaJ-class molecular chaperone
LDFKKSFISLKCYFFINHLNFLVMLNEFELEYDTVTCPDCEGTGKDIDDPNMECFRCDGTGQVFRPDDIPPD